MLTLALEGLASKAREYRRLGALVLAAAVGGARGMLDDGLYTRFPKPDFALALHCKADGPVGTVSYCAGPMLASSTSVAITSTSIPPTCVPATKWMSATTGRDCA